MITKRQKEMLKLIVEEYIKTAKPVSSNHICKTLKCSSATIRNEMALLEEQGLLEIDLAKGNIAIMGQIGSGKENLISTIIWSSIVEHTPHEINYYVIDMGAETLKKFSKFPHVGEVVTQEDNDKITI